MSDKIAVHDIWQAKPWWKSSLMLNTKNKYVHKRTSRVPSILVLNAQQHILQENQDNPSQRLKVKYVTHLCEQMYCTSIKKLVGVHNLLATKSLHTGNTAILQCNLKSFETNVLLKTWMYSKLRYYQVVSSSQTFFHCLERIINNNGSEQCWERSRG